jgi:hypothetical protein
MVRVQITAIHMVGGVRHEHIADVRWTNIDTKETGQATRQQMVDWLRQSSSNHAWVYGGGRWIEVRVVNANPPYIQTYADDVPTDNLLALPRY